MKINSEQISYMLSEIKRVVGMREIGAMFLDFKRDYSSRPIKDWKYAFRWELFFRAHLDIFACHVLYKAGYTDSHIDTALRSIMKQLEASNERPTSPALH